MELFELNTDNVSDYKDILDPDISESIGREFYRGVIAVEDGLLPAGAMVWEYKDLEEVANTRAEICFIHSESGEAADSLLAEFDEQASSCAVQQAYFELPSMDEEILQKLSADGFEVSEGEGMDLEVTVSDLTSIASLKKKLPNNIVGLNEIKELQFMQGVMNCLFHGKKGLIEDLEYLEMDWFDMAASCCVINDHKVSGMFLVHRFPSGILMPMLLTAIGPEYREDLARMVVFAARGALSEYPGDTRVIVRRHNESVDALTRKLLGQRRGVQSILGKRG